jgi:hypothetical protein
MNKGCTLLATFATVSRGTQMGLQLLGLAGTREAC